MKSSDKFKLSEEAIRKLEDIRKEKGFKSQSSLTDAIQHLSLDDYKRFIRTKRDTEGFLQRFQIENICKVLEIQPIEIIDPKAWKGEMLCKYTQKFDALIEEKTRRFVGRKFVFEGFETFIKTKDRGYFTVIANPGEGKSAIASQYVNLNSDVIYYFNVRSDSQNRADQFLENVCYQLIYRYQLEDKLEGDKLPRHSTEDGAFFKDLLQEVSDKIGENERLIIVIDALDEVDLNSHQAGANILYLPRYLPEKVYFLLTCRDEDRVLSRLLLETPNQLFYLKDYSAQSREDIKEYIRSCVEKDEEFKEDLQKWIEKQEVTKDEFINTLASKSENNFMYLRYVIPEIAKGYYQDLKLDCLPQGLWNYYRDHWGRMNMDRIKINIVYLLTVIRRPISVRLIAKFATVGELQVTEYRAMEVLKEWSQFLTKVKVEEDYRYKVYHASFADFLQSDEMVKAAGVEICNIHGLITDKLWQELYGDEEEEDNEDF